MTQRSRSQQIDLTIRFLFDDFAIVGYLILAVAVAVAMVDLRPVVVSVASVVVVVVAGIFTHRLWCVWNPREE